MTDLQQISTVVWGTGNMGRAAIRLVDAHPRLALSGVIVANPDKVGRDAGDLAGIGRSLGIAATDDADATLAAGPDAVAYMASGDIRPDDALADVCRALRSGAVVVTPAMYSLYDPRHAPEALRQQVTSAASEGGSSLFVSGIDPGWGNDILPALVSGLAGTVEQIRCQEIFDYSHYDQPDAVRTLVGMGEPMDYEPPMVAPTVPTMVWGGQIHLLARALEVEVDDIVEKVERRPLDVTVDTKMGRFEAGTQGALRFEVLGMVGGEPRLVVEHVTRISNQCAIDWPLAPDDAPGVHRVIIEGNPRIEVAISATDEGGGYAAGGNATAAGRLVNAIPWLRAAEPGLYDGLEVPLEPAIGKLGRTKP